MQKSLDRTRLFDINNENDSDGDGDDVGSTRQTITESNSNDKNIKNHYPRGDGHRGKNDTKQDSDGDGDGSKTKPITKANSDDENISNQYMTGSGDAGKSDTNQDNQNKDRSSQKKPEPDAKFMVNKFGMIENNQDKGIPNSTRLDHEDFTSDSQHYGTGQRKSADFTQPQKSHKIQHSPHGKHRKRKHHKRRKQFQSRFTTEATIRRVAADVVREKETTWRNQTAVLRHNLNQQAGVLSSLKEQIAAQESWWIALQENNQAMALEHQQQEVSLRALRDELENMHRLQQLQEATFRDMEMAHAHEDHEDEQSRFEFFVAEQEKQKISDLFKLLNLTDLGDVDLIKESNGSNISNVFVFPRTAAVTTNRTAAAAPTSNQTSMQTATTTNFTLQQTHFKFLTSKAWPEEICYARNGTKEKCSMQFHYSDPCIHFFCESLCDWNLDDCNNYEPGPPTIECPYAKCEEVEEEESSLVWLWILIPSVGGTALGNFFILYLFVGVGSAAREG